MLDIQAEKDHPRTVLGLYHLAGGMFLLYTAQTREHRHGIDICCHKSSSSQDQNELNLSHNAMFDHLHLLPKALPAVRSSPVQKHCANRALLSLQLHSHSVQEGWFPVHVDTTRWSQRGHSYQKPFRKVPIRTQLDGG